MLKDNIAILKLLQDAANENNVHLVPSAGAFFLFLVHLFDDTSLYDENKKRNYICYSYRELANLSQFYHSFVASCMFSFEQCKLIERVPYKKTFITYLDLALFQESCFVEE